MSNKLTEMAKELLIIESDITFRFDYSKERPRIDDFTLYVFNQTWGSTALGFGGIGGQALTQANTYVFVPETCEQKCFVYFGGRFAYAVPWSQTFAEDLRKQSMKSVAQSCAYYR
jgi:hypothetical protein